MKYRADIDGLRAVAVIPVILFHAGFPLFSGGFVGVDVFFVISGYLITSIIASELSNKSFSIVNFYERRARRILPALFFVMLVSFMVAYFILEPSIFLSFSKSLISVSLFVSNFQLLKTPYFDLWADVKPMLHTWSLAVEEQFYIFFPLILSFLWKFKKKIFYINILFFLLSFLICNLIVKKGYDSFAFYMLPTRGFELLLGAQIAFYFHFKQQRKMESVGFSSFFSQTFSFLGLILIIFSILFFDNSTPFPSFYTLVPIFGAGLIILFSSESNFIGRFLSNKYLVKAGLISYSAYLWHQPLLVFTRIIGMGEPRFSVKIFVFFFTFCLAYVTWLLIESPFRKRDLFSRKHIFVFSICGIFLFCVLGALGILSEGMLFRYSSDQISFWNRYKNYKSHNNVEKNMRYECGFNPSSSLTSSLVTNIDPMPKECYVRDLNKTKSVFLWGDSHVQMLYKGLNSTLPAGYQILQVASGGCSPNINFSNEKLTYCQLSNHFALKSIKETNPDVVIVAQARNHDLNLMKIIAISLKELGIKKIIFTGPAPIWEPVYLPSLVAFTFMPKAIPRYSKYGLDKEYFKVEDYLKSNFFKIENVFYASLKASLCSQDGCLVYLGEDPTVGLTIWDNSHLTPLASEKVAKELLLPLILDQN